jgi:hypothetical protein
MLSGIRAILFQTELEILPIPELRIEKAAVRNLYNKLHEPDGYKYENLDMQLGNPTLSTRRQNGKSECAVGPNVIRITETHPEFDIGEFVGVVKTILKGLGSTCPPFISQRCRIECLGQPNNTKHAIDLLANRVANLRDTEDLFGRPASYFGVRFRFLPRHFLEPDAQEEQQGASPEEGGEPADPAQNSRVADEGFVTIRFDSYTKDVSQVWMEAAALFPPRSDGPLNSLERIGDNILQTYEFLTEKGKAFLDKFDVK